MSPSARAHNLARGGAHGNISRDASAERGGNNLTVIKDSRTQTCPRRRQSLDLAGARVPVHSTAGSKCEDRVLEGPASGGKGSKGGPYQYCNHATVVLAGVRRGARLECSPSQRLDWRTCSGLLDSGLDAGSTV